MFKVDNEYANANLSRTIRFTDKIFEELGEVARANNVSFNVLVLQCCRYALDSMKSGEDEEAE